MRKKSTPTSVSDPRSSGNKLRDSGTPPIGEPSNGDDPDYWGDEPGSTDPQKRPPSPGVGSDLANEEVDQRITRSKFPKDREKRLKAMKKIMVKAIKDYNGDATLIAAKLSVVPQDVHDVISADPDLIELKEIAENAEEANLMDIMSRHAETSRSPAAARWLLERKYPEKYAKTNTPAKKSKRSKSAPATPDDLPSAITAGGEN